MAYHKNYCIECSQPFELNVNVFTELGLKETKISGICEKCWDNIFSEDDYSEDD